MVQIKRAYLAPSKSDGYRVLVDRLWPRGRKKSQVPFDEWLKDIAPSAELRKKFGHDPRHWKYFVSHYKRELKSARAQKLLQSLIGVAKRKRLTLIYGAHDEAHNQAVVLKSIIERKLKAR